MNHTVIQLYPESGGELALKGLFLRHALHQSGTASRPLVYANFITSMDGRIATPKPGAGTHQVPPAIANGRDWRLYQELAAQADILITSARYFRQLASGNAQDLLPVGPETDFDDLRAWRVTQGLPLQPAIAIVSSSLDIPRAALQPFRERSLIVVTGADADPQKVQALQAEGVTMLLTADAGKRVTGPGLLRCLTERGFGTLYAIAGPRVFHTLAAGGVLNRLYLTVVHRLIGGKEFDSLVWGEALNPAVDLVLRQMFYDSNAPMGAGQWLSVFDVRKKGN